MGTVLSGVLLFQAAAPVWAASAGEEALIKEAEIVEIKSDIWETPVIPDAPAGIVGVSRTEIGLNETSGDGTWKFLYDIPDYSNGNSVPFPGDKQQDFDFSTWNTKNWENIKVPGEAVMQGRNILTNNEYYYQREITIPEDFNNNRILVRFDGVYSNARVWINGKYIRTHVGGFTTWDCDITEYAEPGETVTMTVGVADIYADTKGIWNPEGKMLNNPSNATEYAHHNIGGILRDVSLVAIPRDYIARTYVKTEFDDNFYNADLEVTAQLGIVSDNAALRLELLDGEEVVTRGEIIFEKKDGTTADTYGELSMAKRLSLPVEAPKQWDAEHPNLYTLRSTLVVEGEEVQVNQEQIGFREIQYSGRDGTDGNKVYVNGREVKLRGTCRHDVSDDLGRSMTREEAYEEAKAYKNANINFIRTSHYPASEDLLDACDEMGIYVEQETAVCFQGYGSHGSNVYSKYEDYLPQFTEMIERDRNRASILIWSVGNESNYNNIANQSGGNAIQAEKDYLEDIDTTRPCIFSWPNTGEPWELADIYSQHYANVTGGMGSDSKPILHDEYAHISCYNMDELQRDVNVRNFWGESVKKAWENIFTSDGALGGALWGGIDDVFYIPEGTQERWQSHSDGQTAGYGEWGSVLDAYLREKPEAYLTKKAYSPVRVDEDGCSLEAGVLYVPVKNWFDHTNLNEVEMECTTGDGSQRFSISDSIEPHSEGVIAVPGISNTKGYVNLKFYTADGIMVDEYNIQPGTVEYSFTPASENPPEIEETEDAITVKGAEFEVAFSKETGLISRGTYGNEKTELLTGGPYLHVTGTELGSWIPDVSRGIEAENTGNYTVVTMRGNYENGQGAEFRSCISGNGIISTEYTLTTEPAVGWGLQEVGISYDVASNMESVSWKRDGLYSAYPEDHIGRNEGTAFKVRAGAEETPDQYGQEPAWPWKDDMKNYFVYATDNPDNGLVTNDFKTMRENIYYYDVNYGSEDTSPRICVEAEEGDVAARVEVSYQKNYIDDRDERIQYSEGWAAYEDNSDYAGTETYSSVNGASCEFTFTGTGIRYIGSRQNNTGKVKIYIDGAFMEEADTYSDLGNNLKQSLIYSIDNLEKGEHTIRLETSGGNADSIVVDAFEILNNEEEQTLEQAQLIIDHQWYYPNLGWGNYTGNEGRLYGGYAAKATIRLSGKSSSSQDTVLLEYHDILAESEEMVFTGTEGTDYQTDRDESWTQWAYGRTVTYLMDTDNPTVENAGVSFTFTGTGIRFIGAKEENQGIAQIAVDGGAFEEIDLFNESQTGNQAGEILYEKMWEETGTHTITIQRSGRKNPNATAANISLDAFGVIASGEEIPVTGIELDCTETELEVGEERMLTASVQPENATNKTVDFRSDNEEVVDVDGEGLMTAVSEGEAVITAECADGGLTAECRVKVRKKGPSPGEEGVYSLKLAVNMAEKLEQMQTEYQYYTEESWAGVQEALDAARALLETENISTEQADEAFLKLVTVCNLLEDGEQKEGLKAVIEGTRKILTDSEGVEIYTPESVEGVKTALKEAERVFALESADQGTINTAARKLMDAVTSLLVMEADTRLDILIQKAEELLNKKEQYTPASVENLEKALAAAKETAGDPGAAEEEINAAYDFLAEAMAGLVRKANKDELKNALDKAEEILAESVKYVESTISGLEAVKADAQAVYEDEQADADTVGEALKKLIAEILKARLLGDVDLNGSVDTQDAAELLKYNAELKDLTPEQAEAGDVNRDTVSDTGDATVILQFSAEKISEF
jgi:beta-galactosidase